MVSVQLDTGPRRIWMSREALVGILYFWSKSAGHDPGVVVTGYIENQIRQLLSATGEVQGESFADEGLTKECQAIVHRLLDKP